MSIRLFSQEDEKVLVNLYDKLTNKELVTLFNGQYSREQIKNKAKSLGLNKDAVTHARAIENKTGAWEEWEKQIILKHYPKESIGGVRQYLPERSEQSIRHKASRMGISLDYDTYCEHKANGPKEHSDLTKSKMSISHKSIPKTEEFKSTMSIRMTGENHPNWQGGRSFIEYDPRFNSALKREILNRDSNKCFICENKDKRLVIHHIDHDKNNSSKENLITLCITCHNKHHAKNNIKADEQTNNFINHTATKL